MFDSLARLADCHARRVGLFAIAFFLLAGALGGSVATAWIPTAPTTRRPRRSRPRTSSQDAGPAGPRR